jgi:transcription initiation factor IIE alpha subunit
MAWPVQVQFAAVKVAVITKGGRMYPEDEEEDVDEVHFVTLYARIVNHLAKHPRMAQETLARRLNVTMRTVQRHLTELEREGFVQVTRERKPYTYEIAWDRPIKYFEQLNIGIFRPDMLEEMAQRNQKS